MPLKHHTETAYILLLGIVTAVAGFLASILPHVPEGLPAWSICIVAFAFYPLLLARTFKENRADYEFRALHWAPSLIFAAWIFLELLGSKIRFLHILHLGFFFLWSLPLVALIIAFLILFSLHVIRRWIPRVTLLSIVLGLFTAGAVAAEAGHLNPRLQRTIFSEKHGFLALGEKAASTAFDSLLSLVTVSDSSGSLNQVVATTDTAVQSSVDIDGLQMKSSLPPAIATKKPRGLSASGPEDFAFIALGMLALYSITLHVRARRRLSA